MDYEGYPFVPTTQNVPTTSSVLPLGLSFAFSSLPLAVSCSLTIFRFSLSSTLWFARAWNNKEYANA
jgi:hypothetical protein